MRRFLWIAALFALLIVAWTFATRETTVHFSGDLAQELQKALLRTAPQTATTNTLAQARIEFVSVTDWEKLAFVPGATDACGPGCMNPGAVSLVRVLKMSPRGVRKQVFINIARFLDTEIAEVFTLSQDGRRCLVQGLAIEATSLLGADWPDHCLPKESAITRWKAGLF